MPTNSYYDLCSSVLARSSGREPSEIKGETYSRIAKAVGEVAQRLELDGKYEVDPHVFSWLVGNYANRSGSDEEQYWCCMTVPVKTLEDACGVAYIEATGNRSSNSSLSSTLKSFESYASSLSLVDDSITRADGTMEEGVFKYFGESKRMCLTEGVRHLPNGDSYHGTFKWCNGKVSDTVLSSGIIKRTDGTVEEGRFQYNEQRKVVQLATGKIRDGYVTIIGECTWQYDSKENKMVCPIRTVHSAIPTRTLHSIRKTTEDLLAIHRSLNPETYKSADVQQILGAFPDSAYKLQTEQIVKTALRTKYLPLYKNTVKSLFLLCHPDKLGATYKPNFHLPIFNKLQGMLQAIDGLATEWENSLPQL